MCGNAKRSLVEGLGGKLNFALPFNPVHVIVHNCFVPFCALPTLSPCWHMLRQNMDCLKDVFKTKQHSCNVEELLGFMKDKRTLQFAPQTLTRTTDHLAGGSWDRATSSRLANSMAVEHSLRSAHNPPCSNPSFSALQQKEG